MKFVTEKFLSTEELEDFSVPTKYQYCTIWRDEDGHPHREDGDGPAYESEDSKVWWKHGKQHREDGQAYIDAHKSEYYLNGKLVTESTVRALGKMK